MQWTFPIVFSPVDSHILYTSTQHVWKTTDQGETWTRISPDLTRHDPKTMGDSGGPITHDMNSPEVYATVFALGPSKKDVNVLWAGSDDGLINVTRDGGKTWKNVTPKDMPDFGRVSIIDASAFDAGTAYVAVKKPLLDDFAPYIFRTHDYGATWTKIVNGIRADDYVHAVREDPTRRGLLYAGTQHGFYISYDDGDHWQSLSLNLPDTQVCDIGVEANDVVISTHGRGFYILDRVGPLRQYSAAGPLRAGVPLQAGCRDSFGGWRHDSVPAPQAGPGAQDRSGRPEGYRRRDVQRIGEYASGTSRRRPRRARRRWRARRVWRTSAGADGQRAQQRLLESPVSECRVVPRHDSLGRRRPGTRGASRNLHRAHERGRPDADAAARREAPPARTRRRTPICRRSSISPFRFATR